MIDQHQTLLSSHSIPIDRQHNFCAGPATLPLEVLKQAQTELLDYQGKGLSVMEMSHRSAEFGDILATAQADLRELLNIPDDYAVLFLQGGASLQFSNIPLNLGRPGFSADYLLTGMWSRAAIAEAKRYGDVHVVASSEEQNFTYVPAYEQWSCRQEAAYLHVTPNETIHGVEFDYGTALRSGLQVPADVPVVADLSSTILSRPINVEDYDLIYAGAQKNIGPAGVTLVIIRKSLVVSEPEQGFTIPRLLSYHNQINANSMINTPPTYGIYLAGLVFSWLKQQGGLTAMQAHNQEKSAKLYSFIDNSAFYHNPVALASRSCMNIPFILHDQSLESAFLVGAQQQGLLNLKGHRTVGGMRASLYNAISMKAVDDLISYMQAFEQTQGLVSVTK